eukprot:snap_masked-scaffold_3-processed-gene-13.13-mRNA-1 protein AED:1.00 eAED:1.00 QI:0/-1/0/0/-1/1/1/0/109
MLSRWEAHAKNEDEEIRVARVERREVSTESLNMGDRSFYRVMLIAPVDLEMQQLIEIAPVVPMTSESNLQSNLALTPSYSMTTLRIGFKRTGGLIIAQRKRRGRQENSY